MRQFVPINCFLAGLVDHTHVAAAFGATPQLFGLSTHLGQQALSRHAASPRVHSVESPGYAFTSELR